MADDLTSKIVEFMRGSLAGATTDMVGAPVDIITAALRPLGYKETKPIGGSAHLRELLGQPSEPVSLTEIVGGLISPAGAAKAMIVGAVAAGKNVDRAKEMLKMGLSPATVYKETGVYKEHGKYKAAVSDADLKDLDDTRKGVQDFKTLYAHDQLLKMYPELGTLSTAHEHSLYGTAPKVVTFSNKKSAADSVMITGKYQGTGTGFVAHELQHVVQQIEGFKNGGSAEEISRRQNIPYQEAYEQYYKLPGEVEARFTESVKHLTQRQLEDKILSLLKTNRTPATHTDEFYSWDNLPIKPKE